MDITNRPGRCGTKLAGGMGLCNSPAGHAGRGTSAEGQPVSHLPAVTTRPVGVELDEVAVDGQAIGRVRYNQDETYGGYTTTGELVLTRGTFEEARDALVARQAEPTNYGGWLALLAPEGQGPGIYRITRTSPSEDNGHSVGCEDCGKTNADSTQPFYRWVELHDVGYPLELGICQECLTTQVAAGMPHDEPLDGDGARCHFYPPTSAVERMRAAHLAS